MSSKDRKLIMKGILFLSLLLLVTTSLKSAKPNNTLYPINNYFAFDTEGSVSLGLDNKTVLSELGIQYQEIMSETNVYKFRFIFTTPDYDFEMLSIRLKMIFSEETTERILWGHLHNITVNIFPFNATMIDGNNNSVQIVNALDLYKGTTIEFDFNKTTFEDVQYFELGFSSWNATENIRGIQFEHIYFHLYPQTIFTSQTTAIIVSFTSIIGIAIVFPQKFTKWLFKHRICSQVSHKMIKE
jgi:hypothetical protein